MTDNTSHQDSSVESEDEEDSHVSPEILAESIRSKTDALHAQGFDLADQLERMAEAEEAEETEETEDDDAEESEVNLAGMMTELLETASDLVEVAHAIEAARLRDRSK